MSTTAAIVDTASENAVPVVKRARQVGMAAAGLVFSLAASSSLTTLTPSDTSTTVGTVATTLNFPVARGGDTSYDAYLRYHTADGTALAGSDYTGSAGTILIPAGAASALLPVAIAAANGAGGADKRFQLLLDSATGVGPAPAFSAQQAFAAETTPFGIAKADLNGDGRLDLIVANYDSDTVSVLFNTTAPGAVSPSFSAQQSFPVGDGPNGVSVADFNGDGRLDLSVANYLGNTVSVLLNTTAIGDSTASFASEQSLAANAQPGSAAVIDINRDGLPDLASANGDSTVSVFINTTAVGAATASFASQQSFTITSPSYSIVAADLNGDGLLDLITANQLSSGLSVLFNGTSPGSSSASFSATQGYAGGEGSDQVAAADINGDGRPDMVVEHYSSGSISIFLNTIATGSTSASFAEQAAFATGDLPIWISTGDLNGDGKLDVFTADVGSGTVSVFVNTTPAGASTSSFAARQILLAGAGPGSVESADFNGDGKPDLLVSNTQGASVSVLLNTTVTGDALPDLADAQNFATGANPQSIAVADFNGDYKPDLVTVNSDPFASSVSVLLNTSAPASFTTSYATPQTFATGSESLSVAATDLNRDGRPDLVTTNRFDNAVSVLLNTTATGATTPSFATQQTFSAEASPRSVVIADINGDGVPDLIVGNQDSDSVSVLLNTTAPGATTASFSAEQPFAVENYVYRVFVADFNGDGKPDLAVSMFNRSTISVFVNTTPAGSSTVSFTAAQNFSSNSQPGALAAADLNADGRADLLAANFDGTISALVNTTTVGATTLNFATQRSFAVGTGTVSSVAATTIDSEGRLYVIATNRDDNTVSVLLNTTTPGSGTADFLAAQSFVTQAGPIAVSQTDVNLDGKPDVVLANSNSDTVSVLLNTQYRVELSTAAVTGTLRYADFRPDSFGFTAVTNAPLSSLQTSASIVVSGLGTGVAVPVTIVGGQYSLTPLGGSAGPYTASAGTVGNGDSISVQQTSSASFSTITTAILTLGSGANAVSGAFDVTTAAVDTTPDGFSFTAASNVEPSAVLTSNTITISGINTGAVIGIVNGSYSLNGAAYTTAAGTANDGDTLSLRVTASGNFATTLTATLDVGAVQGEYAVSTRNANTVPTPFSFAPVTNATVSSIQTSGTILVLGIEAPAAISVVNGLFSINGGAFTSMVGAVVNNGDTVRLQQTASASFSTTTLATLSIDAVSADFSVTTEAADAVPDAFSFTAVSDVDPGIVQTSNPITVSGINTAAAIGVTGGSYSINGGAFTASSGTVNNGDTVTVRQTVSSSFATTTTATLSIGAVSAGYAASTRAADVTPDAFSFVPVINVPVSSLQTSNVITVSGIEAPAAIGIVGGSYNINGGPFVSTAATVNSGDVVTARQTASASFATTTIATLTIGGVNGGYALTTVAASPTNIPPLANAGPDTTAEPGRVYTLNGSASSDPDGTIAGYAWVQIDGTPVTLTGATTATPSFTAPTAAATLVFQLAVTDNSGGMATDTVIITVPAPGFTFGKSGGALNPLWLLPLLLLRRRRAGRPLSA